MARRKDHTRDELKSLILDAAEKIIAEQGLRALTTRRVAAVIGYAPGTIYNVFSDTDDMIAHVNIRTLRRLNDELRKVDLTSDSVENAHNLLATYLAFQQSNDRLWEANVAHSSRQDIRQPESYDAELNRAFNLVARAIDPNASSESSADAQIAVRVLWAALNGIAQIPRSSRMLASLGVEQEDLAENLVESYMRGWKSAPGSL